MTVEKTDKPSTCNTGRRQSLHCHLRIVTQPSPAWPGSGRESRKRSKRSRCGRLRLRSSETQPLSSPSTRKAMNNSPVVALKRAYYKYHDTNDELAYDQFISVSRQLINLGETKQLASALVSFRANEGFMIRFFRRLRKGPEVKKEIETEMARLKSLDT